MKFPKLSAITAFARGTVCASMLTLLGLALLALMRLGIDALIPGVTGNSDNFAKSWVDSIWMIFLIASALALFFYAGTLAASFWPRAVRSRQGWASAGALSLFSPVVPLGLWLPPGELGSGLTLGWLAWMFLTMCAFVPFSMGVHRGLGRRTVHRGRRAARSRDSLKNEKEAPNR